MVKMYTDEPSVSLKLKKGGKVHAKHHKTHEEHGHKAMHHAVGGMMHGAHHAFESEHGKAPKKPSMSTRMKAMNPNMYAKGGKVAHKVMGGGMPMGAPQGMPSAPMGGMGGMSPMGQSAIGQMTPQQRAARAMMVKKALMGMKKGGSADHKMIEKLEKELHHHESLGMDKAHHKKHGGMAHHAHGGKVHHMTGHAEGTYEHHKAMAKHYADKCKDGGTPHMHKMCEHHKHMAKMCKGGKYAEGGMIDKDETRTTIEGNAGKYMNTLMHDGQHHDNVHGIGEVKEGKPGGFKHGGKAHKMHHKATGGTIPSDTHESKNKAKTKMGGTLEGNEHDYLNTEMHSAKKDMAHGTTGVKMGNAGGFKRGGKAHHMMHHKASGGAIDKYEVRDTVEGGNWENRPANTSKPGKVNTKTGEVKESNAGGFKHGGHASKKAYATGGNVNAMGKPVAMPKHFVSRPVANSLQSGTFKKGGKVHHHADGGSQMKDDYDPEDFYGEREDSDGRIRSYVKNDKPRYSEVAVNKAISSSNRSGRKISGKEAKAIHALLKGRHAKGGNVKKFDDGGSSYNDKYSVKDPKAVSDKASRELEEAMNPFSMAKELYGKAKSYFSPPAGSVTKTEKSVTVAPGKKHGGKARK